MTDEPLRTTTYTLTSADALAYEQVAARLSPLATVALVIWLGLWGAAGLVIPPDWVGARLSLSFALIVAILLSIAYVLALLLLSVRQWQRARKRMRRAQELSIAEWPDRLEIGGDGLPRTLAFSAVRRSITGTHLFLEAGPDLLILPRRAFPEEGGIEALEKRVAEAPRNVTPTAAPEPDATPAPEQTTPEPSPAPAPPPAAPAPPPEVAALMAVLAAPPEPPAHVALPEATEPSDAPVDPPPPSA